VVDLDDWSQDEKGRDHLMELQITSRTGNPAPAAKDSEKREREKRLFRSINKCVLGSTVVGGFFAVVAAVGGLKAHGQPLDRTGSVLGIMAIFLGISVVLILVALVRYAIQERRMITHGATSTLPSMKSLSL
jgi:hypothetical protein